MAENYIVQFGGYVLPSTLRADAPNPLEFDLAEQERPRAAGATSQIGRAKSRVLPVRGELASSSLSTIDSILDAIAQACVGCQQLYYGRDDRYFMAQLENRTGSSKDGRTYGRFFNVQLDFRASDPIAWAASATGPSSLTPAGDTVTLVGNWNAKPLWSITIGSGGTGTVVVTNSTTGETATLSGTFSSADVITMNLAGGTILWNGVAAYGLVSGQIPQLAGNNALNSGGANSVSAVGTGVTVSSFEVTYTERYA